MVLHWTFKHLVPFPDLLSLCWSDGVKGGEAWAEARAPHISVLNGFEYLNKQYISVLNGFEYLNKQDISVLNGFEYLKKQYISVLNVFLYWL